MRVTGSLCLPGIPLPGGGGHILCCMVPVYGVSTGDRGEDISGANLGAGVVSFVGCYRPQKIETPREDDYKCLFYSNSIFSCLVIVRCSDGCLSESREWAPGTLSHSLLPALRGRRSLG